eukprot:scaffold1503_cov120-Isochrysis_galbana.AAC.1
MMQWPTSRVRPKLGRSTWGTRGWVRERESIPVREGGRESTRDELRAWRDAARSVPLARSFCGSPRGPAVVRPRWWARRRSGCSRRSA